MSCCGGGRAGVVAAVVLGVLASGRPAMAGPARSAGKVVLSQKSFWRKHYTFFPPKLSIQAARRAGVATDPVSRARYLQRFYHSGFDTPPSPTGWTDVTFDDSSWQVARGRQFRYGDPRVARTTPVDGTDVYLRGTDPFVEEVGLICQRGRFRVSDPAGVTGLTLSVTCRGGFVAYLNGVEVARASLPAGRIAYDTAADNYPLAAHFWRDTIGTKRPRYLSAFNRRWKPARDCDQWALRERKTGPVAIPTKPLRKGINVLALELHRSDYPAEAKRKVTWKEPRSLGWATVGLSLMELRAEVARGAVESLAPRRDGLQVWNETIAWAVGERECPVTDGPPKPMRIAAARNGTFSGQVIVAAAKPLDGIKVAVSELKTADGRGRIPSSAVKVRYGATNPTRRNMGLNYLTAVLPPGADLRKGLGDRFDMLLDDPPAGVRSMPIWVTVRVPRGVPAGNYKAELSIRVRGHGAVTVPVDLHVADWALPDVKDFVSVTNIYQSPESIARFYRLKRWSGRHWEMIERSLKLMGEVGNIGLFFPLLSESQMGNPDSMVLWIKNADGSFTYDFSIFDRYLDTALKHHDRLRYLTLNVWGSEADARRNEPTVTVVDAATGEKTQMRLPAYGTAECEALWRPLLLAIRKRLAARGMDKRIVLGLADDRTPHWSHVAMFNRILPGTPWARESHFNRNALRYDPKDATKTAPVAFNSIVWGPAGGIPDPRVRRYYGWRPKAPGHLIMNFNRPGTTTTPLLGFPQGWAYRQWMDSTLVLGRQGTGRVGGDYWHLGARFVGSGRVSSEASGGSRGTLFGIYLKSAVGQVGLGNTTTDLFGPGPAGPVTTTRFENAREGNQEAEARIFLERALLTKARPLPADLARRCQAVLDEATNVARLNMLGASDIGWSNWQQRSRRLYDLAGEAARALRRGPRGR